jgi:anaphase-promoting complex subunit 3
LCAISQRNEDRLVVMERTILADKINLLGMYQKDNILMSLERFEEAVEVLDELKEYAPFEISVFALKGIIYKRRNMHDRASS